MNKEKISQKIIDDSTSVHSLNDESIFYNETKLEKAKKIMEKMKKEYEKSQSFNYKSLLQLEIMTIGGLLLELEKIRKHVKAIEKLIENRKNHDDQNFKLINHESSKSSTSTDVNQIRRRFSK